MTYLSLQTWGLKGVRVTYLSLQTWGLQGVRFREGEPSTPIVLAIHYLDPILARRSCSEVKQERRHEPAVASSQYAGRTGQVHWFHSTYLPGVGN